MGKTTKIWLVTAASLVLIGAVVFGGVMNVLKWDFAKLQTVKFELNEYDINESYKNISIVTDTAHVVVAPSQNAKHSVACYELKNAKHSVSVKDETLVIEIRDARKWYEHLGIAFHSPKITVYIPQGEYGLLSIKSSTGDVEIPKDFTFERMDISESTGNVTVHASVLDAVKIKTSTGNIRVEHAYAGTLDLSVSTGEIVVSDVVCGGNVKIHVSTGKTKLTDMTCKNLISRGSTGDVSLNRVIAKETISIKRSTGDVRFEDADAAEIFVDTDTGDVTGTLGSEKVFMTQTDTGKVDVPKTTGGGRCEITTDTGDIKLKIG